MTERQSAPLPVGVGRTSVELISIRSEHGGLIDGVLWMPCQSPVAAVIHLHGKGGNFYSGPSRWLPSLMSAAPIAHLSCNLTCHDLGYTRYDVPEADLSTQTVAVAGGMWEDLEAGVTDVAAAVAWIRDTGITPGFLAGHSSGSYYAVRYAAQDPEIAGRILLSPLLSNRAPIPIWFSDDELERALERAEELAASGRGHLLLPLSHWYYAISADSLLERVRDHPEVWETALAASRAPILWIWGSAEGVADAYSAAFDALELADRTRIVLAGAEHHYSGHEESVAHVVSEFILDRARSSDGNSRSS